MKEIKLPTEHLNCSVGRRKPKEALRYSQISCKGEPMPKRAMSKDYVSWSVLRAEQVCSWDQPLAVPLRDLM